MIYSSKKNDIENFKALSESASSEDDLSHKAEDLTPNNTGFEGMSIEDYLGYNPDDLGITRSEELENDPAYGNFFRNPAVMEAFTEHFDLSDPLTRKAILVMNEAEQSSVLTSLTSKLYDNIVAKVDDIDYGEIPSTKGDVTKLSNYAKLCECINLLHDILKEYKQDTTPIDEISLALANIEARKDLFGRAFKLDIEMPIIIYNNMVLSIINGVSYMIATSIEFIKTPNRDSFQITLDKVAYAKTKSNMLYNNLKKFNKCCKDNNFDKAMDHVIDQYVRHEAAAIGTVLKTAGKLVLGTTFGKVGLVVTIILSIIPILHELVFLFYYTKMRVSEFFDIQADLLQMNAYNVQNDNTMDNNKKEKIVSSQLKIVDFFRKMANKISINNRKAEVETTKEIEATNKKMKINDVTKELPDSVSVLF